jgi:hypothetical protein
MELLNETFGVQRRVPPHVLREYALIADGYRGALCGPRGDIVWMCAPQWHSDAVFSALLGGRGFYTVCPTEPCVWGGSYEQRSLIWRNRWVVVSNIVECREALAYPGDPDRAILIRRIEAPERDATVRIELDLRAGFGTHPMRELDRDEQGCWNAHTQSLSMRWTGASNAVLDANGILRDELTVRAGEHHDLVLELSAHRLPEAPVIPDAVWCETATNWATAVPRLGNTVAPRDAEHAYAVLRGMTVPGGGMAASATMSLPERAERGRNYDYRYSWVRDQCYAGIAAAAAGAHALLDDAVAFLTARVLDAGDRLAPAYTVDGGAVPNEQRLALPGYPGGQTVVAGNHAVRQFQLDSFGEILQLLTAAARHDRLDSAGWQAARVAARTIDKHWREPDAGLWELDDDWWTHSRLSCVAGLRAASAVAPSAEAGEFLALAEAISAETTRRCLNPRGYWQRTPNRSGPDAALVLPPVRGAMAADDARTRATLEVVRGQLCEDGYVYRFPQDSHALGEEEGAFLLCGFLMVLADHHQGNTVGAFRRFERHRASCGPPALFAEEYDVTQRQLRGNLPQAFVHAVLLECSVRLAH